MLIFCLVPRASLKLSPCLSLYVLLNLLFILKVFHLLCVFHGVCVGGGGCDSRHIEVRGQLTQVTSSTRVPEDWTQTVRLGAVSRAGIGRCTACHDSGLFQRQCHVYLAEVPDWCSLCVVQALLIISKSRMPIAPGNHCIGYCHSSLLLFLTAGNTSMTRCFLNPQCGYSEMQAVLECLLCYELLRHQHESPASSEGEQWRLFLLTGLFMNHYWNIRHVQIHSHKHQTWLTDFKLKFSTHWWLGGFLPPSLWSEASFLRPLTCFL